MQLVKGLFISLIVLSFASIEAKPKRADYVVVGIGTAGAVMAKELSDKYTVIGLHEGANLTNDPLIKYTAGALITVPAGLFAPVPFLYDGGNMVPQIYAANQTPVWVEAKPLGGASSINAGAYCKGTTQGYSQWEEIAGRSGRRIMCSLPSRRWKITMGKRIIRPPEDTKALLTSGRNLIHR